MSPCRLLFGLVALALAACQTPYQGYRPGTFGIRGGYTDSRMSRDTFYIKAVGNRFTAPERVKAYVLYRAAELTLGNGADHFVIRVGPGAAFPYNLVVPGTTTFERAALDTRPPLSLADNESRYEILIDTRRGAAPPGTPFAFDACTLLWQLRGVLWSEQGSCAPGPDGAAADPAGAPSSTAGAAPQTTP